MLMTQQLARIFICSLSFFFLIGYSNAAVILYEPFDYAESDFLSATPLGTPNSTTSPIGYLAPNFNNWYGTGLTGNYASANDGQVTSTDLSVPGLAKPSATRSLSLGSTGHTMRLSLNSSTFAAQNQTAVNLTDAADPLAGTDPTLQPSDTPYTGYYSSALRVLDITGLNATGGVLLGFNNLIGAQTGNPSTVAAALTIRPKAAGNPGEFELGVLRQGASNFANATWDTTNTYTTNSTIFVVGKYQTVGDPFPGSGATPTSDDIASLWINPSPATFGGFDPPSPLISTGNLGTSGNDIPTNASTNNHSLQSFVLRQTGSATNNQVPVSVIYDELRVGTNYGDVTPPIPEPATLVLVLLAGGALSGGRRRAGS
jgi:hypothetical protein